MRKMRIFLDVLGIFMAFVIILVAVIIAYTKDLTDKWDDIYNKRGRDDE